MNAIAERYIAAIIKDGAGDRWRECKDFPSEAIEDYSLRQSFERIQRCETYNDAAELGARFFAHETAGIEYAADRWALLCGLLQREGARHLPLIVKLESASKLSGPISWKEFSAAPPTEPEPLIDDILNRSRTMLLCGPSKARKTFTFLYLLLCVAYGRPWLGFNVRKGRAMYINLELAPFELYKRLYKISSAMGITPGDEVLVWNLRGKSIDAAMISREIRQRCVGMSMVIIDPWYRINARSGAEENSNDQQAGLLMELEAATHEAGAALVLGHHFAKGDASSKNFIDRASGAGVFARLPDVFMSLSEHKEPESMTVNMALREFAPVEEFVVRFEHPLWVRDGSLDPTQLKKSGGRPKTVNPDEVLEKLGGDALTSTEWWKRTTVPDATFRSIRKQLEAAGRVCVSSGIYRRKAS